MGSRSIKKLKYFRMMKMRIKKGMEKILKGDQSVEKGKKKKYLHESRHKHAVTRLRGKDGKFLASTIFIILSTSSLIKVQGKKKEGQKA